MATLKKDSSGRITAASADDFVNLLAPPKKSTYDEDMERVTKGMNLPSKPLPSNYPVGQTDASGMTLMPSGNWSNAAGQETPYHKPTITSPPTDEEVESKKKGGKITHYKSAASAVKAAKKRGDKSITVKYFFSHASKRADGIAQRGHTKGRMR